MAEKKLTDKELVAKMLAPRVTKKEEKPVQSMEYCIKFAVKDLEIAKKDITEAAVLSRAKELFAIHG